MSIFHATQQQQQPPKAHLLGLPAELRNRIYRYVLIQRRNRHSIPRARSRQLQRGTGRADTLHVERAAHHGLPTAEARNTADLPPRERIRILEQRLSVPQHRAYPCLQRPVGATQA